MLNWFIVLFRSTIYLFNLYAEYIMRNAGLEETQAGIKIAWRNARTEKPGRLEPMGPQRVGYD